MIGDSIPSPTIIAEPLPKPIAKRKPGRPLLEDIGKTLAAQKPWVALGMSRRTWYRRQAKDRITQ
jgi:hypothetical protein